MNVAPLTLLPSRDLVLIGAGHTHLHVVRQWGMAPIVDVRLTLVSPFSRATYSGMLPGTLAGLYRPDEMEIDLWRLCESCGVRLIVDEAIGLAPEIRRVLLADRPPLRYDVASIGIGSVPGQRDLWTRHPQVLAIKPMATFRARFERLLAHSTRSNLRNDPALIELSKVRVVIVGGGAGGVEVAFGLESLLKSRGITGEVSLLDAHPSILSGYSAGAVRKAEAEFKRRGMVLRSGQRVQDVRPVSAGATVSLFLEDGSEIPAEIVIWATAAAPPPVLQNFQLPKDSDGFLAVRPTLQTTADYPVFAVGDTAGMEGVRIPKAGVYAVREGPVLWQNLRRLFAGKELRSYLPQRGFLSLLSTGDGRAILDYHGVSAHRGWVWRWKDRIDRRFMRMYQDVRPRRPMSGLRAAGRRLLDAFRSSTVPAPMRCSGCGSKVGSRILRGALERLNLPADTRTRLGLDHPDDAAVIDRQAAPIDVLSVDFFPAFLDDPYLVGRIAALHALSDVWGMGAEPFGGMAIVTIPPGSPAQQTELLSQLLAGGVRELTAAGAMLWGGHTIEGAELTIGYSVAGKLEGREPLTKGGLQSGDRIILTRPLGTGTLLAAHRECRCAARWLDDMLRQMLTSNAEAARLARACGVRGATDVTGFGLAGHLMEMLEASGVSARLSLSSLPLLEGFRELHAAGFRSTLDPANRVVESRMEVAGSMERNSAPYDALFDPQTAGGLLIGIAADQADALCRQLRDAGYSMATVIGEVDKTDERPVLRLLM